MVDRVQFFSIYDMSIPYYFERVQEVLLKYQSGWRAEEINDIIELYNIWLFVENGISARTWDNGVFETIRGFKQDVVAFFNQYDSSKWPELYGEIVFEYRHFFWEIVDRFNLKYPLTVDGLRIAFASREREFSYLLMRQRLVSKFNSVIAEMLRENEFSAEWLLSEFVEGHDGDKDRLFFPSSLTLDDRENIISDYLDKDEPNLNYVRLVLVAKKDANLRLSDEVILKATRVERALNEKYFDTENAMQVKYSISIEDDPSKPMKWLECEDDVPVLCYSKPIMLKHEGAELLHYCRYGFEFINRLGIIDLVARKSETSVLEHIVGLKGKYSYEINLAFRYRAAVSMCQMQGIYGILQADGRCIEDAIRDFYERYLKEEYGYSSTALSLPDPSMDWVAKCRVVAPEIDAIAKRYDHFARRGAVDEELLQISSDTTRITGVHSCNAVRYYVLNGLPDDLSRIFHLFFSDQCMLAYVEPFKKNHYSSFYKLLVEHNGRIAYDNYAEYQKRDVDYLIDLGYLQVNHSGFLVVAERVGLVLLKYLYEYGCIPAPANKEILQEYLNNMMGKGWLKEDCHLLSPEERNYFEYYMYNSTYTNGPALRNRYLHGTNSDATNEDVHKKAYLRLLILLVLELLKIEEDLAHRC